MVALGATAAALAAVAALVLFGGDDGEEPSEGPSAAVIRARALVAPQAPPPKPRRVIHVDGGSRLERALLRARGRTEILVRGGDYGRVVVDGRAREGWVTVRPEAGEQVRLRSVAVSGGASYLRFEGLAIGGEDEFAFAVAGGGSHHLQLVDSRLVTRHGAVTLGAGTHDVVIAGNHIRTTTGNGITLDSTSCAHGSPGCSPQPAIADVVIRANRIDGVGVDALRPANFVDLLIEGNDISGVRERGDHSDVLQVVWGGRGLAFRNNVVHDNRGQGFFIKDGRVTDATLENNLFVRNSLGPVISAYDTVGFRLLGNTVWDNEFGVILYSGLREVVLRNNLISDLTDSPDEPPDPAEIDQDWNLVASGYNRGAQGPHDIEGDPRFADPDALDYTPLSRSPAVDAGTREGTPTVDMFCRRRSGPPDLGAVELLPEGQDRVACAYGSPRAR